MGLLGGRFLAGFRWVYPNNRWIFGCLTGDLNPGNTRIILLCVVVLCSFVIRLECLEFIFDLFLPCNIVKWPEGRLLCNALVLHSTETYRGHFLMTTI